MNRIWKRVKPWVIPTGLTLLIYLIFNFVLLIGYVPTASMEPTLPEGSFVIGTRFYDDLETGDIIVFYRSGGLLVKRIAGCPGDQIDLTKVAYMTSVPIPVFEEPVITVPEQSYFVLGDNWADSLDSRYWEDPFVPIQTIVAKVIFNHERK